LGRDFSIYDLWDLEIRSSKLRGRDLKKGILKGVGEKLEWN
jgi:hypothetical protein